MSMQSDTPPSGPHRRLPIPSNNNLTSTPCHLWLKGSCRFGGRCKFSHGDHPAAAAAGTKVRSNPQITSLSPKVEIKSQNDLSGTRRKLKTDVVVVDENHPKLDAQTR